MTTGRDQISDVIGPWLRFGTPEYKSARLVNCKAWIDLQLLSHKEQCVESRLHGHEASSDVDWGKVTVNEEQLYYERTQHSVWNC